jgi:uncharacterized membrane protein YqjE
MAFTESTPSLAAPGSVPRVVVEAIVHRSELASLELREASAHGVRTVALVVFCGTLLLLAGIAGTFAVAAAVWDRPNRSMILALLSVGYLAVSAGLGYAAARRLSTWKPLAESFKQLREDCACLRDILTQSSH